MILNGFTGTVIIAMITVEKEKSEIFVDESFSNVRDDIFNISVMRFC